MKRKAEIQFTATFIAEVNQTDAKWKKLIGDYFDPDGDGWGVDHKWAIESWAEEEVTAAVQHKLAPAMSFEMPHLTEGCNGQEKLLLLATSVDFDGIEFTDSL